VGYQLKRARGGQLGGEGPLTQGRGAIQGCRVGEGGRHRKDLVVVGHCFLVHLVHGVVVAPIAIARLGAPLIVIVKGGGNIVVAHESGCLHVVPIGLLKEGSCLRLGVGETGCHLEEVCLGVVLWVSRLRRPAAAAGASVLAAGAGRLGRMEGWGGAHRVLRGHHVLVGARLRVHMVPAHVRRFVEVAEADNPVARVDGPFAHDALEAPSRPGGLCVGFPAVKHRHLGREWAWSGVDGLVAPPRGASFRLSPRQTHRLVCHFRDRGHFQMAEASEATSKCGTAE